jgi:hypothetical protein
LPAARKPHVAPKLSPKTHPRENSINSKKRSYLTASCLHIKKKCPYKNMLLDSHRGDAEEYKNDNHIKHTQL